MSDPGNANFSRTLTLCGMLSVGAVASELFFAKGWPVAFVVNLACLFILSARANRCTRAGYIDFDHVVAAESLVAFGVFSLVFGLVATGFRVVVPLFSAFGEKPQAANFLPFAEGLATAALAPMFAIRVRLIAMQLRASTAVSGDMDELAVATADLVKQMIAAKDAIDRFTTGAAAASHTTHSLADRMKDEADKWALALVAGEAQIKQLAESSRTASSGVNDVATAIGNLKTSASETAKMLDELARLIEAVERFVEPRKAPR